MPPLLAHIEQLADRWSTVADGMLERAHCIYAARVLVDLFADGDPQVLVMDAIAENRLAHDLGRTVDHTGRTIPGTWTVGVTGRDKMQPGGYRGHIVVGVNATLDDGTVVPRIVDMTAPQYDRPARGIRVRRPLILDPLAGVPSRLLRGYAYDLDALGAGRGWMNYSLQPHPDDYRNVKNWRDPKGVERFHDLWATITEPLTPPQHVG